MVHYCCKEFNLPNKGKVALFQSIPSVTCPSTFVLFRSIKQNLNSVKINPITSCLVRVK